MPKTTYFNTTRLSGRELHNRRYAAKAQQEVILALFKRLPGKKHPEEVWLRCKAKLGKAPLTSIRRAMTLLTDERELIKTPKMKIASYGHKVHLWMRHPGKLYHQREKALKNAISRAATQNMAQQQAEKKKAAAKHKRMLARRRKQYKSRKK